MFRIYAVLALIGAIFPFLLLFPWAREHGFDPGLFVAELYATAPAAIFASDVLYAAGVFLLFVSVEGRRAGIRRLWLYPLVVLGIGLCCALPLFLAARERALAAGR